MASTADAVRSRWSTQARLSWREELVTMVLVTWVVVGLFVDGWAHANDKTESFFTPWHALFYSGYLATALWTLSRYRHHRGVPAGYQLGYVGIVGFALGGLADMAWHTAFGVEKGVEALVSPSHLLLFVSLLLASSSPWRAAWSDSDGDPAPSPREFLPPLLSATLVTATVLLILMMFSPFLEHAATGRPYRFAASLEPNVGEWVAEDSQVRGFAGILLTTVVLLGTSLLLLRRWRVPAGSFTLLFAANAVLVSSLRGYPLPETVVAGIVAGVGADVLAGRLQGRWSTPAVLRTFGFVVPVVLWLTYFGSLWTFDDVGWGIELWSGITVMAGLAGLGLAVLMTLEAPTPTRSSPAAST